LIISANDLFLAENIKNSAAKFQNREFDRRGDIFSAQTYAAVAGFGNL
jgi:hypothetical protein